MTIDDIKSLKDKIYEIEGLLELAQLREDKIPELEPLILGRIGALHENDSHPHETINEPEEEPEPISESICEPESDPEPIRELSEEPESEPTSVVPEPGPESAETPDTLVYGEQGSLFDSEIFSETPADDTAAIEMPYEVPVAKAPVVEAVKTVGEKPAFCLNDRFRFRRELFGNSDAEFSSAMNMIAAMDGYDDAEEYFIDTLGWDPESPEVSDFMAIIKGYFESQRR